MLRRVRRFLADRELPERARAAARADRRESPGPDPGFEEAIEHALRWLCRAHDSSDPADGGVARHFSLISGWSASYPETTGYIVPTMLSEAEHHPELELKRRAITMLDWLVGIQFDEGGFQGGMVNQVPRVPVTFNTGQILLGLAAGADLRPEFQDSMHRASRWLVESMDDDGCWRKHPTPFSMPGEKAYETHVAWGLMEAAAVSDEPEYLSAALRNVDWALSHQHDNGWFEKCCLTDPTQPLTHTLGYALRGTLEAFEHSGEEQYLEAALRTARGLMSPVGPDGRLPGRLSSKWRPTVSWVCLTGSVQISYCWLRLGTITDDAEMVALGKLVNSYVRKHVRREGDPDTAGAVAGSFPIDGDYGRFEYLNWAAKFFIDANRMEAGLAA